MCCYVFRGFVLIGLFYIYFLICFFIYVCLNFVVDLLIIVVFIFMFLSCLCFFILGFGCGFVGGEGGWEFVASHLASQQTNKPASTQNTRVGIKTKRRNLTFSTWTLVQDWSPQTAARFNGFP